MPEDGRTDVLVTALSRQPASNVIYYVIGGTASTFHQACSHLPTT